MKPVVYYFGCINQPGHYMWHPRNQQQVRATLNQPWGDHIDCRVFDTSPMKYKAGRIHHVQKDGWSLLYFADYSVDNRPGSHSTFCINKLMTAEELLQEAQAQWPNVFLRPKFPDLYLPDSSTPITTPSHADPIPTNSAS